MFLEILYFFHSPYLGILHSIVHMLVIEKLCPHIWDEIFNLAFKPQLFIELILEFNLITIE